MNTERAEIMQFQVSQNIFLRRVSVTKIRDLLGARAHAILHQHISQLGASSSSAVSFKPVCIII